MTEFIMGFVVYTLGTIGLLVLGYIFVKYLINTTGIQSGKVKKSYLSVEQSLPLEQRKSIYVLKAGNQRFLLASTADKVSCLAELSRDNLCAEEVKSKEISPAQMHPDLQAKLKYTNFITKALTK